ncbi:MAG TPA: prepilin peptidase [Pyrinomonadaceae bacterium]|jgi:leader peptidase (prepilin peptidase)/N-methyltransferase|nr:prepilin peptidase [Pyrinomonadaceae bacterium]
MTLLYDLFLPEATLGLPLPLACAFIAALGAIIGSFLNVVIHRLPREESIVFPNSRCPSCGTAIRPYDNIPVISYLILRGRCRSCGAGISARYPAVEAFTALLYLAVFLRDGATLALPFDLVFVTALVALIFIDAEHMILPNLITYPGILFALAARLVLPLLMGRPFFDDLEAQMTGAPPDWPIWAASLLGAMLGALAGGGSLWLMGWLWERLRGVEAMGLGDVKMMFMVGAYLGWRLTTVTIFMAVLAGSLTGIALMLRRGQRDMQMLLPFGIFLGAGAIISLLVGGYIVEWYAAQFGIR